MKKLILSLLACFVCSIYLHAEEGHIYSCYIYVTFKDTTVTSTAGMTIKVGDSVHVYVFSNDRLFPYPEYPPYPMQILIFTSENDPMPAHQAMLGGEVTIYRNDTLLYAETDRIYRYWDGPRTDDNIAMVDVFVGKAFSAGFDIIGNIPNVNKKIRYGGKIHPHDSRIVDREITM